MDPRRRARIALACCLLLPFLRLAAVTPPADAAAPQQGLRVAGDQLVDAGGRAVRLLGVNRSGTEFSCIQGRGIFDGPHDATVAAAMRSWGVNAVRVPLNEHCWLGLDDVPEPFRGAAYQEAIRAWVGTLRAAGLYVILDLHWAAPAGQRADRLRPMPDRDHAPAFWREVATAYGDDSAILFDLYNEPYPDENRDTPAAWRCWRDGGTCAGLDYAAAGMQELVDAVRGTGATNVILLSGVQYGNTLTGYADHAPHDPAGNLALAWHAYNFSHWTDVASWEGHAGLPAAGHPLVVAEIGADECDAAYLERLLLWLDARGASYLGWTWNAWGGCQPHLITDETGTPSALGQPLRDHLARLGPAPLAGVPVAGGLSPPPTAGDEAPTGALVLYGDTIAPPFWDGTFGASAKNACDTQYCIGGRCAYALTLSDWGGLDIGRDGGFATTGYRWLVWAFNPHGQPLEDFAVALTALGDGQRIRTIPLDASQIVADLGEGWVRLAVPIGALNPDDAPVYEIQLRNVAGRDLRAIHVDELWLVPDEVGTALATGARAALPEAEATSTPVGAHRP